MEHKEAHIRSQGRPCVKCSSNFYIFNRVVLVLLGFIVHPSNHLKIRGRNESSGGTPPWRLRDGGLV